MAPSKRLVVSEVEPSASKGHSYMWYVYILKCSDNTLYTGITTSIASRIKTHNLKKGAKYTKGRLPVKLVYKESFRSKSKALKREYQIKSMVRKDKEALIAGIK